MLNIFFWGGGGGGGGLENSRAVLCPCVSLNMIQVELQFYTSLALKSRNFAGNIGKLYRKYLVYMLNIFPCLST